MERIEDLLDCQTQIVDGRWIPSLPIQPSWIMRRLRDAWAVWRMRATAVQWPHQRAPQGEQP